MVRLALFLPLAIRIGVRLRQAASNLGFAMALSTTDASVYIRILVDDLIVVTGQTTGIYSYDSSLGQVDRGTVICWRVEMLNPNSSGFATIVYVGNCGAWGATGQPDVATDITDKTAYVGTAQAAGVYAYNIYLDVVGSSGASSIKLSPSIVVS